MSLECQSPTTVLSENHSLTLNKQGFAFILHNCIYSLKIIGMMTSAWHNIKKFAVH